LEKFYLAHQDKTEGLWLNHMNMSIKLIQPDTRTSTLKMSTIKENERRGNSMHQNDKNIAARFHVLKMNSCNWHYMLMITSHLLRKVTSNRAVWIHSLTCSTQSMFHTFYQTRLSFSTQRTVIELADLPLPVPRHILSE